jgi:hypothetical protein
MVRGKNNLARKDDRALAPRWSVPRIAPHPQGWTRPPGNRPYSPLSKYLSHKNPSGIFYLRCGFAGFAGCVNTLHARGPKKIKSTSKFAPHHYRGAKTKPANPANPADQSTSS